jgi:hypothetical protein
MIRRAMIESLESRTLFSMSPGHTMADDLHELGVAKTQLVADRVAIHHQQVEDHRALMAATRQRHLDVAPLRQQMVDHHVAGMAQLALDRTSLRQTLAFDRAAIHAKRQECIATRGEPTVHHQRLQELAALKAQCAAHQASGRAALQQHRHELVQQPVTDRKAIGYFLHHDTPAMTAALQSATTHHADAAATVAADRHRIADIVDEIKHHRGGHE